MSVFGQSKDKRHSTSSMGVSSSLCEQCRSGSSVGGGRCQGLYGLFVLGFIGWAAIIAASEHFESTFFPVSVVHAICCAALTWLGLALQCSLQGRDKFHFKLVYCAQEIRVDCCKR